MILTEMDEPRLGRDEECEIEGSGDGWLGRQRGIIDGR